MAQVNIRLDDDLKKRADALFETLGLNMTTAVTMFVRQSVREGGIPFKITARTEPFYGAANQAHLQQVISQYEAGSTQLVHQSLDALEALADA